jgi:hypothetical protein
MHLTRTLRAALLAALLATAAIALTTVGAEAGPPPPGPKTYKVKADLDGRWTPRLKDVVKTDFLHKGQRVPIECQAYNQLAYGSRYWDLISHRGRTLFVPDAFIKTGTDGGAPGVRACTEEEYRMD